MTQIKTKIGDHFIQIVCESENLMNFIHENFYPFITTENNQIDLLIEIKDKYGVAFTDYKVDINKQNNKIYYRRADYLIEVDSEYSFAKISVFNELALKHALMNLYSAFIVFHKWGLLIHSSCVIDSCSAHIFAGHSGAGKSTAAKLSYPRDLLSDEATLIKITSDGVNVYNSPFRSELSANQFKGEIGLGSVQILYQALQNNRIRLGRSDALIILMDKVFFWPHCKMETNTIMSLLMLLVSEVPVYELHFQKNNTFWELIS